MSWFNWHILAEDIADDDDGPSTGHYTVTDAARDTDTSSSRASESWHNARDDAEEDGEITRSRNRR
jgi:hypothetical protein